ncbi:uncharacterized protein BXZ73DRAFT_93670 [Epithele typhae]|uniref:uncharacterized protein n=1 Tax=Epithele typhae TaxID=378194 RepID=UPI002007603E|nr:uncharacterized protein BXZ73DRAFT_93670 [Epithele typhae]KAH9910550.1 hypothetical protein BXZ73DRAFT_93670 [Epithele typhae]
MVLTSPNQDWIPSHPVERTVVRTYQDGLWGEHEYSRWPQPLIRNMWHIACIPSPAILNLASLRYSGWLCSPRAIGLGFLDPELRRNLTRGAQFATAAFQQLRDLTPHLRSYGDQLCLVIAQCLDRMNRLPSFASVAVAVGAHLQRVALELLGLRTYLHDVLPRIDSTEDFSTSLLPVLGVFGRDGATVQLATRIGMPVWFLQPLTRHLKIWCVVESTSPFFLASKESDPPMHHHPDQLGAVANLTSSWVENMVFAITGQLCTSRLGVMEEGAAEGAQPPFKSTRLELTEVQSQAPPRFKPDGTKKRTRRGGRRSNKPSPPSVDGTQAGPSTLGALSPEERHPSRCFTPPAFVAVPDPWVAALDAVSPLPQPCHSVHQYLHNAVRIRNFCKLRLLDPVVSGQPLTIAEWRAALWGDYQEKPTPEDTQDRAQERCARLFGNGAALSSYSPATEERLESVAVSAESAASDLRIRRFLLWECHEVNFRCELNALDAALVPRGRMSVMERVDDWRSEDFDLVQREVVRLYVSQFVARFGRLPVPPIPHAPL